MRKNARNVLSAVVLLIFLLLAWSSNYYLPPDKSDAVMVRNVVDCRQMPEKSVEPVARIILTGDSGDPLAGLTVKLFVTYQLNEGSCDNPFIAYWDERSGQTDANGVWVWVSTSNFLPRNSQDLIRVQVKVPATHEYNGADEVFVYRYDKLTMPLEIPITLVNNHGQ